MKSFLYWLPRLLAVFATLFVFTFVSLVFEQEVTWIILIGSLMPGLICLILTIFSWIWDLFGGIAFIILAIVYLTLAILNGYVVWTAIAFMTGLLALIGILFFVNYFFSMKSGKTDQLSQFVRSGQMPAAPAPRPIPPMPQQQPNQNDQSKKF